MKSKQEILTMGYYSLIALLSLVVSFENTYSQIPQGINYQAIARDAGGNLLLIQNINVKFKITNGAGGSTVYEEYHNVTSNTFGLFTATIGNGTVLFGNFSNIPWNTINPWLTVEMDASGGSNYIFVGQSQFMSVPYSLYAANATSYVAGTGISINGPTISNTQPDQLVSINGSGDIIVAGTYPNFIVSSNAQPGIYILSQGNYTGITVPANNFVKIDGSITLASNYSGLDNEKLLINGGSFIGNNTFELEIGNNTTFNGTTFENIILDGFDITYLNCVFSGNISTTGDQRFVNCKFNNVITGTSGNPIVIIENCEIVNSTINRIDKISNCKIDNCTIGSISRGIASCCNNSMDASTIYLGTRSVLSNNHGDEVFVIIGPNVSGYITITGNVFEDLMAGQSTIISIDCSNNSAKNWLISGNTFEVDSGDPSAIFVTGSSTSTYQILKISNNSFLKGTQSINHSGNIPTVVSDNLTRQTTIGVSNGGNLTVANNFNL